MGRGCKLGGAIFTIIGIWACALLFGQHCPSGVFESTFDSMVMSIVSGVGFTLGSLGLAAKNYHDMKGVQYNDKQKKEMFGENADLLGHPNVKDHNDAQDRINEWKAKKTFLVKTCLIIAAIIAILTVGSAIISSLWGTFYASYVLAGILAVPSVFLVIRLGYACFQHSQFGGAILTKEIRYHEGKDALIKNDLLPISKPHMKTKGDEENIYKYGSPGALYNDYGVSKQIEAFKNKMKEILDQEDSSPPEVSDSATLSPTPGKLTKDDVLNFLSDAADI